MAAAFPFTVSTTGRLLFFRCFMKSPERRRKVVSDWMSLVMSSIGQFLFKHLSRCYQSTLVLYSRKDHVPISKSSTKIFVDTTNTFVVLCFS